MVGSGIGTGIEVVGNGLGATSGAIGGGLTVVGGAIGYGLDAAAGGVSKFFSNMAYNMAMNALYESAVVLVALYFVSRIRSEK